MKRKKRLRLKKKVKINFFITLCLIGIIFSSYKIINWYLDSQETKKIQEKFDEPKVVIDNENTEIVQQEETIDEKNPYWDYIKMSLIDVDFKSLKETNSDTIGWIKVEGTNINYPFVQTDNNTFYLDHSISKSKNSAGWVFLDYRNNIKDLNKNTILYAHNRVDKIMFGTLENILKTSWINNTNNYIVKMSTETENTLWQVFSVYNIKETNDYLRINFNGDDDYEKFLNMLISRSEHNFNTSINANDKILTLSTCHKDDERTVLHAKLIKYQKK